MDKSKFMEWATKARVGTNDFHFNIWRASGARFQKTLLAISGYLLTEQPIPDDLVKEIAELAAQLEKEGGVW